MNLTHLPVSVLVNDRSLILADIKLCEKALRMGVRNDGHGNTIQDRLDANRRTVQAIEAELWRRPKSEFAVNRESPALRGHMEGE